ncbi:Calx-beta domain-containing protein [Anaerolineales bacterium HSG6]|nr:Calx-beta domain-containing protein [Anaerolineales bacterium HSG6]
MSSQTAENEAQNEAGNWMRNKRRIIKFRWLTILFLLISCSCIFCSSQTALMTITPKQISASMLADDRANYSDMGDLVVAPLDLDGIIEEAALDELRLRTTQTPDADSRFNIALLPNPIIQFYLTPTPLSMLNLTPTPKVVVLTATPNSTANGDTGSNGFGTQTPQSGSSTTPNRPPGTPVSTPVAANPTDVSTAVGTPAGPTAIASATSAGPTAIASATSAGPTAIASATPAGPTAIASATPAGPTAIATTTSAPTVAPSVVVPPTTVFTPPPATVVPPVTGIPPIPPATAIPTSDSTKKPTSIPQPILTFAQPVFTVHEGEVAAIIQVNLSFASVSPVTVYYTTQDETAIAGQDYTLTQDQLIFAAGETTASFTVPILADLLDEAQEVATLILSNPVGASIGGTNPASLLISDDDSAPMLQFSQPSYLAQEGTGTAIITMTLSAPSGLVVVGTYNTVDDTAIAGLDYTARQGQVTFQLGQTVQTDTVLLMDNNLPEPDRNFLVNLTNVENARFGTPNPAQVVIRSDDLPEIAFTQSTYSVMENAGQSMIAVTLSTTVGHDVFVAYSISNSTATSELDYSVTNEQLTISAGQTTASIVVSVLDDSQQEIDETVQFSLSQPDGAIIGSLDSTTMTILDDDGPPRVEFTQTDYSVDENDLVLIPVTLRTPSGLPVSVDYQTENGTALFGDDYTATTGTLTFAPNQTRLTITIPIIDDLLDEATESLQLSLSNPVDALLGSITTTTVSILDNDPSPQVQFDTDQYFVNESVLTTSLLVILSEPSALTTTIALTVSAGTAQTGVDYSLLDSMLVFPPGQTSQAVAISIYDDLLHELGEQVILQLYNPTDLNLGTPITTSLNIVDNDNQPTVQLEQNSYTVPENNGMVTLAVTLTTVSGAPTSVTYQTDDGSALAGSDYTGLSGIVIIPAGQLSQTFTIPISDSPTVEPDETFTVTLSVPLNAILGTVNQATVTIVDDDIHPEVWFDQPAYIFNENSVTSSIKLMLNKPAIVTGTVKLSSSDGTASAGADYLPISQTVTFLPGQAEQTIAIVITDDVVIESIETFVLQLSNYTNLNVGSPNVTLVSINEDDTVLVQFDSTIFPYSVPESIGLAPLTVTLNSSAPYPVVVDYSTSDDSAMVGSDYTNSVGTLTFAPAQTVQTFTVPIIDDPDTETIESFDVVLSNPISATLGLPDTAKATILDNDTPTAQFSSASYSVMENGGMATITVTLDIPASIVTMIAYSTTNNSAIAGIDYSNTTGILTFAPGQIVQTISVPIIDNLNIEPDRTFFVNLGNPTGMDMGTPVSTLVTIVDEDTPTIQLTASSYSQNEDIGSVQVEVTLSKAVNATINVDYATSDGTASAGSDYTTTSGTLTFIPSQISQTLTIPLGVETVIENDETCYLSLSNPISATLGSPVSATLTIVNDDIPSVYLSNSTYSVNEAGGTVNLEIQLSAPALTTVTVSYATADGSASVSIDYNIASGSVTFAPGQTVMTVPVTIFDDGNVEPDKTFSFALSSPNKATLGSPDSATITIVNDDVTPPPPLPKIQFALTNYTISEGDGSVVVQVTLSPASGNTITVDYATNNVVALSGSDYTVTTGTLTFASSETSQDITVPIMDDATTAESSEDFTINLSNPTNATLGSPNSTTVTIQDNEPTVQFASNGFNVAENGGPASIDVTLSHASIHPVVITYTTSNGTALDSTDYQARNTSLTISAGLSGNFTIPITDDTVFDGDKLLLFTVTLSSPVAATLGTPDTVPVVILDNETTAPVSECHQVKFTITTTQLASTTTTIIEAKNNYTATITLVAGNLIAYRSTLLNEYSPTLSASPTITGAIDTTSYPTYILYNFSQPFNKKIVSGNKHLFTTTYRYTTTPEIRDDTFIIRYFVGDGGDPKIQSHTCSYGAPVVPVISTGLTISITTPAVDYEVINDGMTTTIESQFSATTTPAFSNEEWVSFEIVHVATGEIIWSRMDYGPPYCAFGGNPCRSPKAASDSENPPNYTFDWDKLTNGLYRLDVTAYDKGNVGTDSRFFIINGH